MSNSKMDYAKLLKENMERGFHIDTSGFIPASGGWECNVLQEAVNDEPFELKVGISEDKAKEMISILCDNMDSLVEELTIRGALKFYEQEAERSKRMVMALKLEEWL